MENDLRVNVKRQDLDIKVINSASSREIGIRMRCIQVVFLRLEKNATNFCDVNYV